MIARFLRAQAWWRLDTAGVSASRVARSVVSLLDTAMYLQDVPDDHPDVLALEAGGCFLGDVFYPGPEGAVIVREWQLADKTPAGPADLLAALAQAVGLKPVIDPERRPGPAIDAPQQPGTAAGIQPGPAAAGIQPGPAAAGVQPGPAAVKVPQQSGPAALKAPQQSGPAAVKAPQQSGTVAAEVPREPAAAVTREPAAEAPREPVAAAGRGPKPVARRRSRRARAR
jgi:hypothetical protein